LPAQALSPILALVEAANRGRALEFWRAVATVPSDRTRALAGLEACFAAGTTPKDAQGPHAGRLLATTLDFGLNLPVELLTRLWMPWKGKTFDAARGEGWNLFTPGFRFIARVLWPSYERIQSHRPHRLKAFRFVTNIGPSQLSPERDVLRIFYDLPENPPLIRPIVDELVPVDDGLYLGQALRPWRGSIRRAAWFALERVNW
jgi:hypothetical protein